MAFLFRVPSLASAALLVMCAVLPVQTAGAQQQGVQRIPVSSLLARLDRLEADVVLLRQRPEGASGEVMTRIDQLESELRRLTGIVERLEFDATRRAEISEKRMLDLDTRLQALESQRPTPFAAQPTPAQSPAVPAAPTLPPPAPFAQSPVPSQPIVNLGGGPAVAFGAPRQVDTTPDLAALPFPTIPIEQPQRAQSETAVAVAGAAVAPSAVPPPALPEPTAPNPVALSPSDPQVQYDEALRLLNLGEFDSAGVALESLVVQHPQHPVAGSAQYWLGDMHLRVGRYNEAAKAFLESFKGWPEGPKAPDSLLKLGMTLSGLGQKDEACLTFTEFPGRYPDASPTLLRRAQIEAERTQCGG